MIFCSCSHDEYKLKHYTRLLICKGCNRIVKPQEPEPVPIIKLKQNSYFITETLQVFPSKRYCNKDNTVPRLNISADAKLSIHKKPRTKIEKALGYFADSVGEDSGKFIKVEYMTFFFIDGRSYPDKMVNVAKTKRASICYLKEIKYLMDNAFQEHEISVMVFEFLNISWVLKLLSKKRKRKQNAEEESAQKNVPKNESDKNLLNESKLISPSFQDDWLRFCLHVMRWQQIAIRKYEARVYDVPTNMCRSSKLWVCDKPFNFKYQRGNTLFSSKNEFDI